MRTYSEYLNTMTVRALQEIAKREGIKGLSAMRKSDLINILTETINGWHIVALDMNATMVQAKQTYTVPGTTATFYGAEAELLINHENRVRRYNPTMARDKDGKVILTPKQRRRVGKKTKTQYARMFGKF